MMQELILIISIAPILTIMAICFGIITKMLSEEPNEEERKRMIRIATYGAIGGIV